MKAIKEWIKPIPGYTTIGVIVGGGLAFAAVVGGMWYFTGKQIYEEMRGIPQIPPVYAIEEANNEGENLYIPCLDVILQKDHATQVDDPEETWSGEWRPDARNGKGYSFPISARLHGDGKSDTLDVVIGNTPHKNEMHWMYVRDARFVRR